VQFAPYPIERITTGHASPHRALPTTTLDEIVPAAGFDNPRLQIAEPTQRRIK
jgi:hypothetical protein